MGKNKINIALFGLGRIGQMHAENLINHPQFYLKYIFDIDKKLTEKLSKKYPEKKALFYKLADDCGKARIYAGLHYPSDHYFGQFLINILP